jgi:hypothetical protein
MDEHEVCRKQIQKLESELNESHEREAEQEIELAEKDQLIAALTAELMRYRVDREFAA